MFLVFFALVELFVDVLRCRQAVDEESSEKLKIRAHPIAILPAVGHYFVDFVRTCCWLCKSLTFLDQFINLVEIIMQIKF